MILCNHCILIGIDPVDILILKLCEKCSEHVVHYSKSNVCAWWAVHAVIIFDVV